MAPQGNGDRPYSSTPRGRAEALVASLKTFLRRTGAGSIAIAIGALGAAALLATTLIFPPAPVQRIFQTDGGNETIEAPGSNERSKDQEPITVPTGPSDGDQVASTPEGSSGASIPQVLGTLTTDGSNAAGSGQDTTKKSGSDGTPSLDEDGAKPGDDDPTGSPAIDDDTTTAKEEDDEVGDEEETDDDRSKDGKSKDSKSKDSKSKDSKQAKKYSDDSDDSDDSGSKDSKSKDSKSKDSDDSDDD